MRTTHSELPKPENSASEVKAAAALINEDKELNEYVDNVTNLYTRIAIEHIPKDSPELHLLFQKINSYEEKKDIMLKNNRWRLFIDGDVQTRKGDKCHPLSFDYGGENIEPGYHKGLYKAFQLMLNTRDLPLSPELIIALHDMAVEPILDFTVGLTDEDVTFGFTEKNITRNGLDELKILCQQKDPAFNIGKSIIPGIFVPLTPAELNTLDITTLISAKDYARINVPIKKGTDKIEWKKRKISQFINEYNVEVLEAKNDRALVLKAIVNFARNCDLLHLFMDGNIRTFVFLVLNRELIKNGFSPAIFKNPNCFDGHSLEELVTETITGMNVAKIYNFSPIKQNTTSEKTETPAVPAMKVRRR